MKHDLDYVELAAQIKTWGQELGFQQVGIADVDLTVHEDRLKQWLAKGYQGEMEWMGEHGNKRSRPQELLPGTMRVISARMDYLPGDDRPLETLGDGGKAYISRYALGRDYHKLVRKRLAKLATRIADAVEVETHQRPFVDSAPVLERALAEKAGLGWIGKSCMLINNKAGTWFFLGELFTNLPLPVEEAAASNHCGTCRACLDVCPTQAFVGPYELDARKCISYLTIEHKGSIPEPLRAAMGNRVFGCDDCQLVCPWNKFAQPTDENDFKPRHNLSASHLVDLFNWSEEEFLQRTEGSAIRRIGYERWLRNLAIALGNGPSTKDAVQALQARVDHHSPVVREHVAWALDQHRQPVRWDAR
ncbi:tRNA epoxyqueuosine(34) reductase QueG [Gilvimarinus sp. F26214L]|uniref:tRNA epoxyqueuosine(34) reductase QueG n=1 Tax=Gilvimarinus sp. DZF01 TaxID=3461371 RepID=UPI0040457535